MVVDLRSEKGLAILCSSVQAVYGLTIWASAPVRALFVVEEDCGLVPCEEVVLGKKLLEGFLWYKSIEPNLAKFGRCDLLEESDVLITD